MWVKADAGIGELGHVGAAEDDETRLLQPGDGGSVGGGGLSIFQHFRSGGGHFAREIEEVLHREWNAGKGRRRPAPLAQLVHVIGGGAGATLIEFDEGAGTLARGVGYCGERFLNKVPRCGLARGEAACEFR